jgi:hypothetical protein
MAVSSRAVTVTTTATRLDATADSGSPSVQGIMVHNNGAASVYLGGADVTTPTGFPLEAGESMAVDLRKGELLHGIVASGTVEVRVLEVGVD